MKHMYARKVLNDMIDMELALGGYQIFEIDINFWNIHQRTCGCA